MLKFIAAIDNKRGLATDEGIPWKLSKDLQYYREKTEHHDILMGFGTYIEFEKPMPNRRNFVVTSKDEPLKPGFIAIKDAQEFISGSDKEDKWIIGGAKLFESTIAYADQLYITQILADFHCTKFFPEYKEDFYLAERSELLVENDLNFYFEVWNHK